MDEDDFEEQQNQEEAQDKQSSRGGNVGHRAADAAKGVAKNAGNVSNKLGSSAEKFQNKANAQKAIAKSQSGTQAGAKAATKAKKLEEKSEKIKKAAEKAKKVQEKAEKFAKIAAKIGKIITFFGVIILILLIIIGLLVFIISGWGMLLSGFKKIAEKFYDTCFNIMNGGEENVKDGEIVNLMKNIEEMGYDLYGYGFVGADNVDDDGNHVYYTENEEGGELIETLEDIDAYRNLVAYMISDNYAYYVKNNNFNFTSMFSDAKHFFGGLFDRTAWGSGLISIYEQADGGDKITGVRGDAYDNNAFGEGAVLGAIAGTIVPGIGTGLGAVIGGASQLIFNYDNATSSIEVNRSAKTLEVTSIGILHNKILSYSLDGWTGRYSMPLEFLLATHIATMAPDLSYKLATTFNTDVEILLWKSTGNTLTGGIQLANGNVLESKDLGKYYGSEGASNYLEGGTSGSNTGSSSIGSSYAAVNQDPANSANQAQPNATSEICPLKELGISEPAGCNCGAVIPTEDEDTDGEITESETTQTTIVFCDACKNRLNTLKKAVVALNDNNFSTYVPYLNSVTDHWFRDVYFTAGAIGTNEVIVTDEDYYKATGEMWSTYERDSDGYYELYVYLPDDSGNYEGGFATKDNKYLVCRKEKDSKGSYKISEKAGNLYERDANGEYNLYLLKDANVDDENKEYEKYDNKDIKEFRVGKKAVTEQKSEDWNVYELDTTPTETGWTPFEIQEDSAQSIKAIQDIEDVTLVYNLKSPSGKITQTEDGVRGETHAETKKMFLDDYYLYNGSGPTAAKIEAAKDAVANKIMQDNGYVQGQVLTLSKKPTYVSNYASGTNSNPSAPSYAANPNANSQETEETKEITLPSGRAGLQTLISLHNSAYISKITGLEDNDVDDPDTYRKLLGNQVITTTYEGQTQTATIDEISGPINILHNSLTAFSILKNMHTLDAEYIYHDFKELIVELDYFDKEDLTDAEREVMMFPISELSSAGWPMARYDKSEEFYGTLLHSEEDYKALKATTIADLNEAGINVDITQPEEGETTEQEERSDGSQTTKQTETGHITYESIPANSGVDKCQTKSVVNGIEFYDYKQGSGSDWANKSYWGSTMAAAGCGPTSTAILLSGYGINVTPDVIADEMVSDTTLEKVATSMNTHGVPVAYYRSYGKGDSDAQNCINDILEAFNQGKPVICLVGQGTDGYFTGGGHFMVLLGITEDGTLRISNPGKLSDKQSYTSLEEFVKNYMTHSNTRPNRGIVVPANAPDGSTYTVSTEEFKGYKGGEEVISPVTGEVIKYGTVERTNMELVNAGVDKEEAKETVGFIKIRVLGDEECKPGNVCDYFKNIEGGEGYNYFWEEYADAGITNHVLYIEGFDVSEILKNIDSNNSVKGRNINALKKYIEDHEEFDFYSTEYEVPKLAGEKEATELKENEEAKQNAKYVVTDKKGKIYIKEGAVIGHTYTQEKAKTTPKKIKTYDENENETTTSYEVGNYMRIIFRDADDQVVENVEKYMELEEPTQETICGALEDLGSDAAADEKIKAAVSYFVSQGFTVEAACGILGNLIQESSLDPSAVSSSGYHGLVQWDKDGRWPTVKDWMAGIGYNEDSFSGQIRAIYECEYNQMPANRWEELKKLTDVEKAAELFAVYDERCTGGSDTPQWYPNGGNKYQHLLNRRQGAKNALAIYNGASIGIKDGFPQ